MRWFSACAAALLLIVCACSSSKGVVPSASAPPATDPRTARDAQAVSTERLAGLREEYLAAWLRAEPAAGRALGLHEHDGKVADYTRSAIEARIGELKSLLGRLDALSADALDADARLDLALLKRHARLSVFRLVSVPEWQTRPAFYEELFAVNVYLDRDYAPLKERAQRLLEHQRAALAQVAHMRQNLTSPLPRPIVETAIKIYEGYAAYLKGEVRERLAALPDARFQQEFARSNQLLATEAERFATHLRKFELPRADASHVLGPERYAQLLQIQEELPFDTLELKRRAAADLAKNSAAYDELSRRVRVTRPPAAALLDQAALLVERSREFVAKKRLVTVPGAGAASVRETPPYMRYNQAFLNGPGPFDPAEEAFYYITLPDPSWPKREREQYVMTYGNLLATSVHEVYPGHFVQGQWMRRAPTRVQKMMDSYSFVEGWAHYVEQMMVDEGFGAEDEQYRLGQLADALLRDCRVLASIGIHTEGMSVPEAARLFETACHQDTATAREQAVRGTFDPGYFAYTLGKLQILELRAEAQRRLGARFELGRFHDALLAHGAPPVPMIRERVLADLDGVRALPAAAAPGR